MANFYVATNGTAGGTGAIDSPWNLQTALNHPASVHAGDTIYLRGGTYTGKFDSDLTGSNGNPITVRSYLGEWAKIDGYVHTTLATGLSTTPVDPATLVFTSDPGFGSGDVIDIGNEHIRLAGKQANNVTWNNCTRGWDGTTIASHSIGALAVGTSKTLTMTGSYVTFRDFEVLNSWPIRSYDFDWGQIAPAVRGSGIFSSGGTGNKYINLVIHDNQEGIYLGEDAASVEVYGCVIYNNGFDDTQRGHGQGLYMQNKPATQRKVRNVISFNGFNDGMKAYSESAHAENFLFEHVISFNNGVNESFPGNPAGLDAKSRAPSIYAGTGNSGLPANNILLHDCYTFLPLTAEPVYGNVYLGYLGEGATGLEITNSEIIGGQHALGLAHFSSGTVTGNTIYAQDGDAYAGTGLAGLANVGLETGYSFTWDSNTYFDQTPTSGGVRYPFTILVNDVPEDTCEGGTALRFSYVVCSPNGGWKQITGFDTSSTYNNGTAPSATRTYLTVNEYDTERAHVAIYNPSGAPSVSLDVSGIYSNGDVVNIFIVEEGFSGGPTGTPTTSVVVVEGSISIPMNGTTVIPAIGNASMGDFVPATMRPYFGAVVLVRVATAAAFAVTGGPVTIKGNVSWQ